MIRGVIFIKRSIPTEKTPNFTRIKAEVTGLKANDNECLVKTDEGVFKAKKFSSLPQDHFTKQKKYHAYNSISLVGLLKQNVILIIHHCFYGL